jgi:hypothetical protein
MIKSKKCVASLDEVNIDNLLTVQIDYEKNNFVVLSDEEAQIELVALNGTRISNIPLYTSVPFFCKGIYFLKVKTKDKELLKKIVF